MLQLGTYLCQDIEHLIEDYFIECFCLIDAHLTKSPCKGRTLAKSFLIMGVAAIALWFHLRLPSCGPGFKSQLTIYAFFNLYY